MLLHTTGSRSPLGTINNRNKVKFDNYFSFKDRINLVLFFLFILINLITPFMIIEAENFIPARPMNSPLHIVPE